MPCRELSLGKKRIKQQFQIRQRQFPQGFDSGGAPLAGEQLGQDGPVLTLKGMNVTNITDLLTTPEECYGNEQTDSYHYGSQNDESPLHYGISDIEHDIAVIITDTQSVVSTTHLVNRRGVVEHTESMAG